MNYYQHHIGDFIRDTARLTDHQCMAYMRMLWVYYETEAPLLDDQDAIAFKIGANVSDVHQILKHFFFLHDDGLWHQSRCDKEILAFRDKSDKAKKSANARWINANAMRAHNERNANEPVLHANQEPVTSNQEPKTINKKNIPAKAESFVLPDWIDKQKWDLWQKTRKGKKMLPEQMQAQVDKLGKWKDAGMDYAVALAESADNGWTGLFEPKQKQSNSPPSRQSRMSLDGIDYTVGLNSDGSLM